MSVSLWFDLVRATGGAALPCAGPYMGACCIAARGCRLRKATFQDQQTTGDQSWRQLTAALGRFLALSFISFASYRRRVECCYQLLLVHHRGISKTASLLLYPKNGRLRERRPAPLPRPELLSRQSPKTIS